MNTYHYTFRPGVIVRCVNTKEIINLTINKDYEIIEVDFDDSTDNYIYICNDAFKNVTVFAHRFRAL